MPTTKDAARAADGSGDSGWLPGDTDDDSTLAPVHDNGRLWRASRLRTTGLALLWLVVLAGAVGLLGVRSTPCAPAARVTTPH